MGTYHIITTAMMMLLLLHSKVNSEVITAEEEERLVSMIKNVMECNDIPGLTMTLVKGKESKTFAHGVANKETGEPVTTKTLFNVGAISQSFTAVMMAELTQRSGGVIHFDSPISKLIGGELKLTTRVLTEEVTLKDAMMHRTGLAAGRISTLTGMPNTMSRSQLVSNLKELPQSVGFRDSFQFNPFLFTLATYVGEKISGSTWEKLIRGHILDKLLMSSTLVTAEDTSDPAFATAYVSDNGVLVEADRKLFDLGPLAPSGTMYTNAEDMVKALKFFSGDPMMLSQVKFPGPLLEELMAPHIILPLALRASLDKSSYLWPVPDVSVGYGIGFFRNMYRGYQLPWQLGNVHGFDSLMWVIPERNIGIFIAINGQKYSQMPIFTLQTLAYYAADLTLGFEPWLNETTACTFPEPWIKAAEFPNLEFSPKQSEFALADYQGTFSNPLLGDLQIRKSSSNSKALTFSMKEVTGELLPEGGNFFRLFLDGKFSYMKTPIPDKKPLPFVRMLFEFKGPECIGLKFPDTIFGGAPVDFKRTQGLKEEL